MDLTKNQILDELLLETVFNKIVHGEISVEGIHDSIKKQIINFAKKKKEKFINVLHDSIDKGLITVSMIGGNMNQYISEHTIIEQSIIEKFSNVDDIEYHITDSLLNPANISNNYRGIKDEIDENGFMVFNSYAKVYSPILASILSSKDLRVTNMLSQIETTIDALPYFETYLEGYKEGEQYFLNEFKASSDILYGPNAEQYVRDINYNYYEATHSQSSKGSTFIGWGSIKKSFPIILTHEAIKVFGYYSGIVNKVDELIKKYPSQFANFNKCEHDLTRKHEDTKPNKTSIRQNALIKYYKGINIRPDDKEYKYRKLENTSDRLAEPPNKKAYGDFINDMEIVIKNLEHPEKQEAIDEFNTYIAKYNDRYT